MEHEVDLIGRKFKVMVHKRSKYSYLAVGDYEGRPISGRGRSVNAALRSWHDTARYYRNQHDN